MAFLQDYTLSDPNGGDPLVLAQALPISAFAIDRVSGDWAVPPRLVYGIEAYIQRLEARLHFFRGEWFLDRRQGLPYYRDVLVKDPRLQVVESLFRRAILGVPLTQEVLNMRIVKDTAARVLYLRNFEVRIGPADLTLSASSTEAVLVLP